MKFIFSKNLRAGGLVLCIFFLPYLKAQETVLEYIPAEVDFSAKIQDWDGFGFNYVETCQSRDYEQSPQDYGGFSLLSEQQKSEIAELVFGEEGLKVQIVKMFLDPWHQKDPGAAYDHETTTENMREFVQKGLRITEDRGDRLEIITTLYGPPAWATAQKFIGGRDLDPVQTGHLCNYMIDWVKYLRRKDFPVRYLSLHNEGEDFYRWNYEDGTQRLLRFDYNMYWPPQQVNRFLKVLPPMLKEAGLDQVKVTNGEPSNWTRFYQWGYTHALYEDEAALKNLGLLTTHGFINGDYRKLSYGLADGRTTGLLRRKNPDLHAWITSYSWGAMGTDFIKSAHEHLYTARVNALIPWAGIQNPSQWIDGDPNPNSAIRVNDDGTCEVMQGYYFYKQLTTAGFRGMSVAGTMIANPVAFMIAFGSNGTGHPDAFVLTSNIHIWKRPLEIKIRGTAATRFKAFRSSEDGKEQYTEIGLFEAENGSIIYDPPPGTTTTFIAVE